VHHHEQAQYNTQAEQHKPLLGLGMLGIIEQERAFVGEGRDRFLEPDAVSARVRRRFLRIPFKAQIVHGAMYIQCMEQRKRKESN